MTSPLTSVSYKNVQPEKLTALRSSPPQLFSDEPSSIKDADHPTGLVPLLSMSMAKPMFTPVGEPAEATAGATGTIIKRQERIVAIGYKIDLFSI